MITLKLMNIQWLGAGLAVLGVVLIILGIKSLRLNEDDWGSTMAAGIVAIVIGAGMVASNIA